MKNAALRAAGVIFLLVSILHLARFFLRIKILAGSHEIPLSWSLTSFIVALCLAVWMFSSSKSN